MYVPRRCFAASWRRHSFLWRLVTSTCVRLGEKSGPTSSARSRGSSCAATRVQYKYNIKIK